MSAAAPLVSVILVTRDTYRRVRKTVQILQKQSARGQLEIVIVTPSQLPDAVPEDWECFWSVKVVSTGPFRGTGHPRAAAVAHASGEIIAFGEDHCFPHAGWAESVAGLRLLPWAALGPALENGNPGPVSWADFLLNFGPAATPTPARAGDYAPWHNTAYKRELLRQYSSELLEQMLDVELRLQRDLVQRGHQIYLAAETTASHVNISRWESFIAGQFAGGRLYGAYRFETFQWPTWKRLVYAALSPLIPLVRFTRIAAHARRSGAPISAAFLVACAAGLSASALGEATGYLLGAGDAGRSRLSLEFERHLHVRPADVAFLDPD